MSLQTINGNQNKYYLTIHLVSLVPVLTVNRCLCRIKTEKNVKLCHKRRVYVFDEFKIHKKTVMQLLAFMMLLSYISSQAIIAMARAFTLLNAFE